MIRLLIPIAAAAAFAAWTAAVYFIGVDHGKADARARQVPALVKAVEADRKAFRADLDRQDAAAARVEQAAGNVAEVVEQLRKEARDDPARDPCPVTPDTRERLRNGFARIDRAAAEARAGGPQ